MDIFMYICVGLIAFSVFGCFVCLAFTVFD